MPISIPHMKRPNIKNPTRFRLRPSFGRILLAGSSFALAASPLAHAVSAGWNGATNGVWATGTNWSATPVPGTGDTATFNNAGNSNTTLDLGAGVTLGTLLFDTSSAAAYTIGSGAVGSQTLTLGTLAGGIQMNATVAANQLINANLALGTTGTYTIGLTNNSATNSLTVAGGISASTSGAKVLTVAGSGNTTISGAITGGTGSIGLLKSGSGTLTLSNPGTSTVASNMKISGGLLQVTAGTVNVTEDSGNNTAMVTGGNLTVSGGTLNLSGAGGWFPIGDTNGQTSTVTVSGGAVNVTNNFGTEVGRLGGGVLTISSGSFRNADTGNVGLILGDQSTGSGTVNLNGGTLTVNKVVQGTSSGNKFYFNGGTLSTTGANTTTFFAATTRIDTEVRNGGGTIDTAGFNATIADVIAHSTVGGDNATDGGLTKTGAGILILSGANTYTGGTTINAGTLSAGNGSAFGTGGVTLAGGTLSNSANQTITNAISVTTASAIAAVAGTNFTVNGNITGSAALGVSGILNSAGLLFGGDNSGYTGTVTVTGANTRLASATAGSSGAAWVVNGNLQLQVTGATTYHLGALSSTVGTGGISGHATNASSTVSTLSVGALGTSTTFSGVIANMPNNTAALGNLDGASNNVLALTKVGGGTLTLSGANTYTGATTINAGSLQLGASNVLADTSNLVLGGGTLATAGFSETLGTLTINTASAIDFGAGTSVLAFADSSAIAWTGTLTLQNFEIGTDTLRFGSSSTALTTAQLSAITLTGYSAGLDSSGFVTFTAVPEPGEFALAVIGLLGALVVARRRSARRWES
jgi:autotransporter-associated beta strand protein